jgi:hypothetical protein
MIGSLYGSISVLGLANNGQSKDVPKTTESSDRIGVFLEYNSSANIR